MLSLAQARLEAQKLILFAAAAAVSPMLSAAAAAQAPAATATADPAMTTQAAALLPVLAGQPGYAALFTDSFRAAVPEAQWTAITAQLRTTLGAPQRVARIAPAGRWAAIWVIDYARGSATMLVALDPAVPHRIAGLRITGTTLTGDSLAKLRADLAALPAGVSFGLYPLDATTAPAIARDDDRPMPLGSAFKLWVLAEAARQVAAGRHRWDEVVPVGPPSLPSGMLQSWPAKTPVTLQTLATLMISISDNTATDTLMRVLGHDGIDAIAARFGGATPVPTTREAFAIKADAALTKRWTASDAAGRRALLDAEASRIAAARLDPLMFSSGAVASESVEWFAAPRDMARLLASLRDAGPVVRAILAVNPGIDPATATRFAYVGFKGGAEPGVVTLNLLLHTRGDRWYALSAGWHHAEGIDEPRLLALVTRTAALVADEGPKD